MTPLILQINVRGIPAPQGSKRGFVNKKTGSVSMVESSKKLRPWRDAVRADSASAMTQSGLPTYDGPIWLDMVCTFTRPKGHYGTGRNAHLLRGPAPARPAGMPDLSKLARSTEDALKDAGVIRDDALIVEYHRLAKVYAGEDRDALDSPGVVIRIYTEEPTA